MDKIYNQEIYTTCSQYEIQVSSLGYSKTVQSDGEGKYSDNKSSQPKVMQRKNVGNKYPIVEFLIK